MMAETWDGPCRVSVPRDRAGPQGKASCLGFPICFRHWFSPQGAWLAVKGSHLGRGRGGQTVGGAPQCPPAAPSQHPGWISTSMAAWANSRGSVTEF